MSKLLPAAKAYAEAEIRSAFEAYFGGDLSAEVPIVQFQPGITRLAEAAELVEVSIADALAVDTACEGALRSLLTGSGTLEQLRAALCEQHINRWADDLAELAEQQAEEDRADAIIEASGVPSFLMGAI